MRPSLHRLLNRRRRGGGAAFRQTHMNFVVGIELRNANVIQHVRRDACFYRITFDGELRRTGIEERTDVMSLLCTFAPTEHQLVIWAELRSVCESRLFLEHTDFSCSRNKLGQRPGARRLDGFQVFDQVLLLLLG